MSDDRCPECGAELVWDEVDIGVGTERGNPGCPECLWPFRRERARPQVVEKRHGSVDPIGEFSVKRTHED